MPKMSICLWFDNEAQEASRFYCSVFKGSKILQTSYYGENSHKPKGSVMAVRFRILGQEFMALNGGPEYKFNPAISLMVPCKTQKEIDYYWKKLTEGGKEVQCGWLEDKFGVSWQVFPEKITKWITGKESAGQARAFQAMMKMVKMDISILKAAYEGPKKKKK